MTDFWTVENAFFVMILMIVIGVVLALVVSPNVDMVIHMLRNMGFDAGAGTAWDTSGTFWTIHNIFRIVLYSPAPLGVIIFIIACTKRQRRDDYAEAGAIYGMEE
jgi:hypothetical protein